MGRRKQKKRQGFSSPETKPLYDAFTNMIDVHGPEKRAMLNTFSMWIAFAAALSTGFGGCMFAIETGGVGIVAGWIIGLVVGAIAFNVVANWLASNRFFRP
jgi:hypothetical protein